MRYLVLGLMLTGCASSAKYNSGPRFPEPSRSEFVVACSMQQNTTHCLCVEAGLLKKFGSFEKALKDGDDDTIRGVHEQCFKILEKEIQAELNKNNEMVLERDAI
jgi:hypothetical protein